MIYQLVLNSIGFDKVGKIGVYLSFLNLLTKEAKYLHDAEYRINMKDQFEARNVLHATAAIWLYNRNSSNKSEIKKADICRTIEDDNLDSSDENVIKIFKDKGGSEIEFLSHSYFGENNKMLHFQHQSFAEILLAEYYMKILLKFALDREFDYEKARIKLSIGEPTSQTIDFLKELISLLRDSIDIDQVVYEKRKLLFPLLASLSIIKNNKALYCSHLSYRWFENIDFEDNKSDIPKKAIEDWPINHTTLDKVVELCKKIIDSDIHLQNLSGEYRNSLFNLEVFATKDLLPVRNIDKWIALVCGNLLYNSEVSKQWFNGTLDRAERLFDMIIQSNLQTTVPFWAREYFRGINLSNSKNFISLSTMNLTGLNFSYSILKGILFDHAHLANANFSNCEISFCDFSMALLYGAIFENAKIFDYSRFALAQIYQGVFFPYCLANKAFQPQDIKDKAIWDHQSPELLGILYNYGGNITTINDYEDEMGKEIAWLVEFGFRRKIWTKEEILSSFHFEEVENKLSFEKTLSEVLDISQ